VRHPRLIRPKVLAAAIAASALLLAFGAEPLARRAAERALARALGAPVTIGSVAVDPLGAHLVFRRLAARDPADPAAVWLEIDEADAAVEVGAALRGRLVLREVRLARVRLRIERREDGTIDLEHVGPRPPPGSGPPRPEPAPPGLPPPPPPADGRARAAWLEAARRRALETGWVQQVEAWAARVRAGAGAGAGRSACPPAPPEVVPGHPDARARWVRGEAPRFLIRRLVAEGVEIEIRDRTAREATPIRIHGPAAAPAVHLGRTLEMALLGALRDRADEGRPARWHPGGGVLR